MVTPRVGAECVCCACAQLCVVGLRMRTFVCVVGLRMRTVVCVGLRMRTVVCVVELRMRTVVCVVGLRVRTVALRTVSLLPSPTGYMFAQVQVSGLAFLGRE